MLGACIGQVHLQHIILRGRWCNIVVLNAHASSEEKTNDSNDSFYEKLEQVFDNFPKNHMKIPSGDFNAKVGCDNIFKPTIGKESLHQDRNNNKKFNCKWAVTRWQWLLCMYINMKYGSKKFMSGGLHEKHAVATSIGNHLSIRL